MESSQKAELLVQPGEERHAASASGVAFGVILLLAPFVVCLIFSMSPETDNSWQQIENGMSKQQVLEFLGEPKLRRDEGHQWLYDFGGMDYFVVCFDENDRVEWSSF